jgi:hypothetical protein
VWLVTDLYENTLIKFVKVSKRLIFPKSDSKVERRRSKKENKESSYRARVGKTDFVALEN